MNSGSSEKRAAFGNRPLLDDSQAFQNNAWDNVVWTPEMEKEAEEQVAKNSTTRLSVSAQEEYEEQSAHNWDQFYAQHENKFFKDRNWLVTEFPQLFLKESPEETYRILEVGCGAGNTLFPLLEGNKDKNVFIYACDFSSTAVQLIKENKDYDNERCEAFVADITDEEFFKSEAFPIAPSSLNVIIMIFVLSAIRPDKMSTVIRNLSSLLKPGGLLLFRDYGRYDLAQLRFKEGRCIDDNFYVRGDGTKVYFFTNEEVRTLMTTNGTQLKETFNHTDRRLIVNRRKQLKMYRVWLQCIYEKQIDMNDT